MEIGTESLREKAAATNRFATKRRAYGALLGVVFALGLSGMHLYALWAGSLGYPLTRMALWILLLILAIRGGYQASISRWRACARDGVLAGWLLIVLLSPLPNVIMDFGIRHRIDTVSDEAKLQEWAEGLLAKPLDRLPVRERQGTDCYLEEKRLPDFVRRIPLGERYHDYSYRLVVAGAGRRYLEIVLWNMRPTRWGVLLCAPTYRPETLPHRWLRQWRPGLYGWQQIDEGPG